MVFKHYALDPHMSVRKNLACGLKNRGMPGPEIDATVEEAARLLQIAEYLDRKPSQLSGGQRQRQGTCTSMSMSRTRPIRTRSVRSSPPVQSGRA